VQVYNHNNKFYL